jgi:hypothetical protein
MIICSSSNIDLIQGVSGYGTAADGATDWRIENTAGGVFNILNSPNLLAPNVSIIDAGNVGVGTIPVSGTNKLQVQGNLNVSADTLSKTYTATNTTAGTNDILTMRYDTTNGLRFQQTLVAANDVRYDVIQKTNNVDYTSPVISFYKGNVGIGTTNPNAELQITCASTATNPDTGGTIIGLYVHNPTNTASQNSVIYNRIAGSSAGKVIYAFNVAGSYGCSMVMNGNDATNRLLRFNNSSDATGTDLMVINNTNGNVSIGNTTTATHKLNVTGSVNVSGGFLVGGTALKPATAGLADTATALATSRNIAGVGFNGSAAIDIPYPNLTNKLTSGTGITISAATPPVISTNLTAGTNVTFTGTAPNITINAAGGTASQWSGASGGNIYYNTGNVGIGTNNPLVTKLHLHNNATSADCRMLFSDNTSTVSNTRGFALGKGTNNGVFIWNYENTEMVFATNGSERMCIASNGNIGIGTNNPSATLQVSGTVSIQTGATGVQMSDMTSGSLKLGNITQNYGSSGAGSTGNMGCIVLECLDNTEIAVHDSGNANHSLIRYTTSNNITMGRNFGWGVCSVFKGNNGTAWDQTSDHRIKENIKKANLNICYDNVKNINLYRFNYKDAFGNGTHRDRTQLGFVAQQVNQYYPKSITRGKRKLDDNREVPDLASIDITQVNFTLFGAVKQLIRVVEKQSNRIKRLEEMLNIVEYDTVDDDADEPYVKIVCEGEVDIDTIVPSEPEETPENMSNSNSSNSSNVF